MRNDIKLKHAGKTVVAMGGGPSLKESAKKVRGDIWISANDHGARLRKVDYCATVDTWHLGKQWRGGKVVERGDKPCADKDRLHMQEWLAPYGVPIISYRAWADHVTGMEPARFDSGMYSAYVAWLMGGAPAVIIGVDCYRGGKTYWHAPNEKSGSLDKPEKYFHSRARDLAEMIGTERVRMLGPGPLAEHFPQYDPDEAFDPDYLDVLERAPEVLERTMIRCQGDIEVAGVMRRKGNIFECNYTDEVRALLERGEVYECR